MTTEYYQIPSQQGLLPLPSLDSLTPDPWLASASASLSSLSLYDTTWGVKTPSKHSSPPSLFEEVDAVSWKHIVPMHTAGTSSSTKAPVFHSTASAIDAWTVVDNVVNSNKTHKRNTSSNTPKPTIIPQQQQSPPSPSTPAVDDKPIEDELSGQNRYKTELCKSFTETGNCRYGAKCQFAHGKEEIRPILRHPKYKTEICKTFHTTGTCPYGIRCRFIHTRSKEESMMTNVVKVPINVSSVDSEEEDADDDDIISLNHPPGIPVPQWSKSWNMALGSPMAARKLAQPEPAF